MQRSTFLALCALALSGPAWAAGTISAGTAKFARDDSSWHSSALADFSGVSEPLTTDHLTVVGWAYRVLGDPSETFLPEPNSAIYGGSTSEHAWNNVDNRNLFRAAEVVSILGPTSDEPSGRVTMRLEITNLSAVEPLTIDVFHTIDMEVGGLSTNSGVLIADVPMPGMKFTSTSGDRGYYLGHDADAWTARPFSDNVGDLLTDGDVDNFDNSGLPASDIDLTAGMQWANRTIEPGHTQAFVASFAINQAVLTPDLSVILAASPDPVGIGSPVDYIATVGNASPLPAPGAIVTFSALPKGVEAVLTTGCENDPLGYPVCQVGDMASGEVLGVLLRAVPGKMAPPAYKFGATVSAPDVADEVPGNNTAELVTHVMVGPRPDLRVTKTNNVGGMSADIDGWVWKLDIENAAAATADATFANGDVFLIDQLPSQDVVYGVPVLSFPGDENDPDVQGTATCNLVGFDLICAATSTMTFPPGTRVEVRVPVLPQALQVYANPRQGGQCRTDPGNVIIEQDEDNNTCSDSVLAMDFMLFSDGFE